MLQTPPSVPPSSVPPFLQGGGLMAGLIREHDWSRTPLGPIEQWPQSLRTALNLVLQAEQPTYLAWGPHYQFF